MSRDARTALTKFRAKYPGAYDKFSDKELLSALQRKYPNSYNDLAVQDEIKSPENILQRAVKSIIQPMAQASGDVYSGIQNNSPWQILRGYGKGMYAPYQGVMGAKNELLEPLNQAESKAFGPTVGAGFKMMNEIATDPLTYIGGEPAIKGIQKAGNETGNFIKMAINPSKQYGKKLAEQAGTVDYHTPIMHSLDNPGVQKLVEKANILKRFGGREFGEGGAVSEKLANLTAKDSQEVINALKSEVPQAVKEGILKPKQLEVGKLLGNLSKAQNKAFPAMKGTKFAYGASQGVRDLAESGLKRVIAGSELGAGGSLAYNIFRRLFGG